MRVPTALRRRIPSANCPPVRDFSVPMTPVSRKSRRLRLVLFVGALVLIAVSAGLAIFHQQPWIIPPAEKTRQNPLTASAANLAAAKETYGARCEDCHGDKGKGDGPDAMMYDPSPSDLTDAARINKLTDGEIFYQITEGRKPMPSFRKKLSEEQRWQLVLYVRSLAGAKRR
jgi:mono/diheme cytochrome c family protein